jgi:hypothetical protein
MNELFNVIHRKFFCKLILFIWFVSYTHPWFGRGYDVNLGTGASVFAFGVAYGQVASWDSFREYLL